MSNIVFPKAQLVLVEDDSAQIRFFSHLLNTEVGYLVDVHTFTDSVEAVSFIERNWIDILITDLDLPEVDGLQLIKAAKCHNGWVQTMLITAVSTSDSLIEACDLGVTDYLLKPVDAYILGKFVQQSLERLERWRNAFAGTLSRVREMRT